MKAKALIKFYDLEKETLMHPGDTFEITKQRFKELNSTIHGNLVELIKEDEKIE
ncbi:MAG TPA: hypothetical protein VIG40_03685 [Tissierellaceae bacterium]